jgi:ABC-type bacteriocin/lantibiotic exporter with double-glycine peptidase domain/CRP-like cAMP-binding protein
VERTGVNGEATHLDDVDLVLLRQVGFYSLVPSSLRTLVARMFRKEQFAFGDEICAEGEIPQSLFVLASGSARVVSQRHGTEVTLAKLAPPELFGADALVGGTRRTETVRASEDCTVFRLPREAFDALVEESPEIAVALHDHVRLEEVRHTLRLHPAFSAIPLSTLSESLELFQTVNVAAGDVVVAEGSESDAVFVVVDGRLPVTQSATGEVIGVLRAGDFFGERGVLEGAPRSATVTAEVESELLRVSADSLHALMARSPRFRSRLTELAEQRDLRGSFEGAATATTAEDPYQHAERAAMPDVAQRSSPEHLAESRARRHHPRRRRFPFVAQYDESDCGVACLAMVARHFGRKASVAYLRDVAGTGTEGTTLTGIVEAGRAIGIDVEPLRASKDRLDELTLPAIVHYKGNHWIVLYGVAEHEVYVADPAIALRALPRDEFLADWTGFAGITKRTDALDAAPVDKVSIKWLLPFVTEQKGALTIAMVLALLLAACEVGVPVAVENLVSALTNGGSATRINTIGLLLVAIVVASGIFSVIQNRVLVKVSVGFDTHSLDFLTGRLLHLPMSYFARRKIGDIERRIGGMAAVRALVIEGGVDAGTNILLLVVAIILMAIYSVPLALLFLAIMPLYSIVMWYSQHRLRPVFTAMEEAHGHYQSRQVDLLKGVETIKTLGAEPGLQQTMHQSLLELNGQVAPAYLAVGRYRSIVSVLTLSTYAVFVYVGALQVHSHSMTLAQYVAFISLVLIATSPILGLLFFWDELQSSTVLLARIHDVLGHEVEQGDRVAELLPVVSLVGQVSVTDVEFRFRESDRPILTEINLEIPVGTKVALVGRSGCGKSTLLRLLAGLIVPTRGSIRYDGIDLVDVRLQELRSRIGYVLQAPYVFDATVAENIAFGVHDIDEVALRRAAEMADVTDFVERLPLGFNTRIGDGGLQLSGGQAQRVSIARALYRDPPVVFFDEATSALDAESEQTIKRNLDQLSKGRTAFFVTHRLASIRDAHLIVVLEAGRIVEMGDHETLLHNGGLYAHLYQQQYTEVPSV